jgi:hypothetical protein
MNKLAHTQKLELVKIALNLNPADAVRKLLHMILPKRSGDIVFPKMDPKDSAGINIPEHALGGGKSYSRHTSPAGMSKDLPDSMSHLLSIKQPSLYADVPDMKAVEDITDLAVAHKMKRMSPEAKSLFSKLIGEGGTDIRQGDKLLASIRENIEKGMQSPARIRSRSGVDFPRL